MERYLEDVKERVRYDEGEMERMAEERVMEIREINEIREIREERVERESFYKPRMVSAKEGKREGKREEEGRVPPDWRT